LAEQLTLNQLVEGSSPSRLTGNIKATDNRSRAKWRGSPFPDEMFAAKIGAEECRALTVT
jgi:hypothetical protein